MYRLRRGRVTTSRTQRLRNAQSRVFAVIRCDARSLRYRVPHSRNRTRKRTKKSRRRPYGKCPPPPRSGSRSSASAGSENRIRRSKRRSDETVNRRRYEILRTRRVCKVGKTRLVYSSSRFSPSVLTAEAPGRTSPSPLKRLRASYWFYCLAPSRTRRGRKKIGFFTTTSSVFEPLARAGRAIDRVIFSFAVSGQSGEN